MPRFGQMRGLGAEEGLEDRVALEQLFATVSGEIFRVYPYLPTSVLLEKSIELVNGKTRLPDDGTHRS